MAINETLGVTATYTSAGGKVLAKSSPLATIMDTSSYDVMVDIDRNWATSAASSAYGGLYVKPTINIYDELVKRGAPISSSSKYLFRIAADVAVVADNENVGALYADARIPAGVVIDCECLGLLMGRGGRGPSEGYPIWRELEGGGDGGPAVTTVSAKVNVTVFGGITGGGGGGGGRGAHWHGGYYNTGISEWWQAEQNQPTSGAGAPFGLRTGTIFSSGWVGGEEFFYKNAAIPIGIDVAPAAAVKSTPANLYNLDTAISVTVNIDRKNNIILGYSDGGDTILSPINKPILEMTRWLELLTINNPNITLSRVHQVRYANDHVIMEDRAYLHGIDRYARNTGAVVENTGAAGLFRGAKGAVGGRVNAGGITRFLCCSSQADVNRIAPSVRGDTGGDVGAARGVPPALGPVTRHAGYYGNKYQFELLEGFVGRDHQTGKNLAEVMVVLPPMKGGNAGPNSKNLNNGTVSIIRGNGGAIGGDEVLTKYDPNGTFDTNARGTNVLKTFEPRWYRHG